MKYRILSLLALAGVLFSSCVKENLPAEGGSILAVMENDDTRTSVTDEGKFTWSEGDQIWLHTTSGSVVGTLSSGAGTASADFSFGAYFGEMTNRAVYPYNDEHSISGDVLSIAMPSSYDLGSNLTNTNAAMYGEVSDGRLKFNHMAGVMRFRFKNVPAGVNKFTITLDKKISGTFTADLTEAYPVIEAEETSVTSEKTITLNFNALTETSEISLYVPLPIGTYNSLDLTLYAGTQSVWTYSKFVTNTINRKSLKLMPTITLGGTIGGDIEGGESDDNSEPGYTLSLTYETTSANQSVKLTYDASQCSVAGLENELLNIDYGDGTVGTALSHTYSSAGVYDVLMTFKHPITEIGEDAIRSCTELVGIQFPETLNKIGRYAFYESGLRGNLVIPENNVHIGSSAFASTGEYDQVIVPFGTDFSGENAHFNSCIVKKFYFGADIPDNDWHSSGVLGYSSIERLIIGNQVTSIGSYASGGTAGYSARIKYIEFEEPSTLYQIGESAFCGNVDLVSITLPSSVQFINPCYVFDLCPKLESINIDSGYNANYWSEDGVLYTLNFESGVRSIFRYPEAKKGEVYEDKSLVSIAPSAFRDNKYLKKVSVDLFYSIGDMAFCGCSNLTEIEGCDYSWSAPDIYIGEGAFRECTSLKEFTIGLGVDVIKSSAFGDCTSLERIYCKSKTPPTLEDDYEYLPVFANNAPGRLICVPLESLELYKEAPGWNTYKDSIVGYIEVDGEIVVIDAQPRDYVDEYGINHGQGVKIGETVWAPVNCGYHATDYKYGKLYQGGRKYGQGYDGEFYDGDWDQSYSDAQTPDLVSGPVSLEEGQSESNANKFYYNSSSSFDWLDTQDDNLWNSGTEDNPVKTEYDPCPAGWRVPTDSELFKLCSNYSSWTTDENGLSGRWFSGSESYSATAPQVFFSAAGRRDYHVGHAYSRGNYGYYWSSSTTVTYSHGLYFTSGTVLRYNSFRALGFSVRCVQATDEVAEL